MRRRGEAVPVSYKSEGCEDTRRSSWDTQRGVEEWKVIEQNIPGNLKTGPSCWGGMVASL